MAETVSEVPRLNIVTVVVAVGHQSKETMAWSMSVSLLKLSQVRVAREHHQALLAQQLFVLVAVVVQLMAVVHHREPQALVERAAAVLDQLEHLAQREQSILVQAVVRRDIQRHLGLVEMVAQVL
jgi:hypothetical protein